MAANANGPNGPLAIAACLLSPSTISENIQESENLVSLAFKLPIFMEWTYHVFGDIHHPVSGVSGAKLRRPGRNMFVQAYIVDDGGIHDRHTHTEVLPKKKLDLLKMTLQRNLTPSPHTNATLLPDSAAQSSQITLNLGPIPCSLKVVCKLHSKRKKMKIVVEGIFLPSENALKMVTLWSVFSVLLGHSAHLKFF